jgi:hypothetical protein
MLVDLQARNARFYPAGNGYCKVTQTSSCCANVTVHGAVSALILMMSGVYTETL